jgi:hypothetical protein
MTVSSVFNRAAQRNRGVALWLRFHALHLRHERTSRFAAD